MNALTNGRGRKSLAEQIDRLDRTLDGLADALNESIATAVRETLHAVLAELLNDTALRAQLQTAPAAVAPAPPSTPPSQPQDGCRRVGQGLRAQLLGVRQAVRALGQRIGQGCRGGWNRLTVASGGVWERTRDFAVAGWSLVRLLRHVLVALAVAGLVSVTAYCAGPTLAAATSGVCGFVAALTVRMDGWLRQRLFPAAVADSH